MDAVEGARQLIQTPAANVPPRARAYCDFLTSKYGPCHEAILTAFAHYAQREENLPCKDALYAARRGEEWDEFVAKENGCGGATCPPANHVVE